MFAIQVRVVATRNYLKFILGDTGITNDTHRLCQAITESVEQIISRCPTLAANEYMFLHDNVAKILY